METEREEEDSNLEDAEDLPIYMMGSSTMLPIKIPLLVDDVLLEMELDKGAAITVISEVKYIEHFPGTKIKRVVYTPYDISGEVASW